MAVPLQSPRFVHGQPRLVRALDPPANTLDLGERVRPEPLPLDAEAAPVLRDGERVLMSVGRAPLARAAMTVRVDLRRGVELLAPPEHRPDRAVHHRSEDHREPILVALDR